MNFYAICLIWCDNSKCLSIAEDLKIRTKSQIGIQFSFSNIKLASFFAFNVVHPRNQILYSYYLFWDCLKIKTKIQKFRKLRRKTTRNQNFFASNLHNSYTKQPVTLATLEMLLALRCMTASNFNFLFPSIWNLWKSFISIKPNSCIGLTLENNTYLILW